MNKSIIMALLLLSPCIPPHTGYAKEKAFYVYKDHPSKVNHYIPSGYMGDFSDIKIDLRHPHDKGTCIRITYDAAKRSQGAGWAGVYWQHTVNNWGNRRGGYDLKGRKALKFRARGHKGGEYLDFFFGGITGQEYEGDSHNARLDGVDLTTEWKEYVIEIEKDADLSHIIGGFGWAASGDYNPEGIMFYVDEIRYE